MVEDAGRAFPRERRPGLGALRAILLCCSLVPLAGCEKCRPQGGKPTPTASAKELPEETAVCSVRFSGSGKTHHLSRAKATIGVVVGAVSVKRSHAEIARPRLWLRPPRAGLPALALLWDWDSPPKRLTVVKVGTGAGESVTLRLVDGRPDRVWRLLQGTIRLSEVATAHGELIRGEIREATFRLVAGRARATLDRCLFAARLSPRYIR